MSAQLATRPIVRSGDPDEVRHATGELTIPHDLAVRDGARRIDGLVNGARVGRVGTVFVRYGAGVEVEAPPTGTRLAMTLPLGPMRVAWPGRRAVVEQAAFALDDEQPTLMRPEPWAGAIVLATDLAVLEDHLRLLFGVAPREPLRYLGAGVRAPAWPSVLARETLRCALRQLDAVGGGELGGAVRRHLEGLLLSYLLLALPHNAAGLLGDEGPVACPPALARAREYLEAHFAEPLSVGGLAREVGMSVRSLQVGFRERYGATPMQTLREIRLQHARRALQEDARRRERTVAEIALSTGFMHLGRFAVLYRRRFGETPSRTLRVAA